MEITKKQIKELSQISRHTEFWCKKNYPEFFNELEIGKWYKADLVAIFNHQEKNNSYGFLRGEYKSGSWNTKLEHWDAFPVEATEAEVFEALKNEAFKRGFVEGSWFYDIHKRVKDYVVKLSYHTNSLDLRSDVRFCPSSCIFHKGKWAEIIPTITREEAEKLLNKKIID